MATTRVTAAALAMMLDLPEGIEITETETASIGEDETILILHLEGKHPITGEDLEDREYELQYRINEDHNPELVGIEPLNTESS